MKTIFLSNRRIKEIIVYVLVPVISVYIASIFVYFVSYNDNAPQVEYDGMSYLIPLFAVNVEKGDCGTIRLHIDTTDPYINHIKWYEVSHGEVQSIGTGWMPLIANKRKASIKVSVDETSQEQVCAALESAKGYVYRLCVYEASAPTAQEADLREQIDCYTSDNTYLFSIVADEVGCYTKEQKTSANRIPLEQ